MSDTEHEDAGREDLSARSAPQDEELSTAALAESPAQSRAAGSRGLADEARAPATGDHGRRPTPLLDRNEVDALRDEWASVQAGFVDEPRAAVENADHLVALTMKRLAEMFATERSNLEKQWDGGDQVSTEDLRLALQRYRSFFDRLLSI